MNGVHDMGGMHGMGPITPEANEPVFHAPWEGRVLALNRATAALRKWTIDASRHSIERIRPADYLRMSYYEKWLAGLVTRLEESGLVTSADDQQRGSFDVTKGIAGEIRPAAARNHRSHGIAQFGGSDQRCRRPCA